MAWDTKTIAAMPSKTWKPSSESGSRPVKSKVMAMGFFGPLDGFLESPRRASAYEKGVWRKVQSTSRKVSMSRKLPRGASTITMHLLVSFIQEQQLCMSLTGIVPYASYGLGLT